MLTKSCDTDPNKQIGSLIEIGFMAWRGGSPTRLVITDDGYVLYIKYPYSDLNIAPKSMEWCFPEGNMDKYIQEHPENVLVRGCTDLVDNIKKFAFLNNDQTVKQSIKDIPEDLEVRSGADGTSAYISILNENYLTHGWFLLSIIDFTILREDNKEKLSSYTLEELDAKCKAPLSGIILVADILLNIARAIMQTKISKKYIHNKQSVKLIKKQICFEIFHDTIIFKNPAIKKFLKKSDPNKTYFEWLSWLKEKYYPDNK